MEPVLVFDSMVRAWACQQRGLCCKGHRISVDRVQYLRILAPLVAAGDPRAAAFTPDAPPEEDGWRGLPTHGERDACLFLTDDERCGFRMTYGTAALPHVCQKYPYIQLYTPTRLRVGLSFTCPTALGLLAAQTALDLVEEPEGEPPVPFVTHLAAAERVFVDVRGEALDPDTFWRRHDALATAFYGGGSGSLRDRLAALVAAAGEEPVVPIAMTETRWTNGAFDGALLAELDGRGPLPPGLPGLWSQSVHRAMPDPPPFEGDEDALLTRYLAHRLLVPAFYVTRTDLSWLLGLLFLAVARYRIERARGATPMFALRHAELLLIHSPMPTRILGEPGHPAAWRPVAAIAMAD